MEDLENSIRDSKKQAFKLRSDHRTDIDIIEEFRKKLMDTEIEEKKANEDTELANAKVEKVKEEVVVLTRSKK